MKTQPASISLSALAAAVVLVAATALLTVRPVAAAPITYCIAPARILGQGDVLPDPATAQPIADETSAACYSTLDGALLAATGSHATLPDGGTDAKVGAANAAADATNIVISIDFWDINFGGSNLIWYTSHSGGCADGTAFYAPNMPTVGGTSWNDVISSATTYASCGHNPHYEASDWKVGQYGIQPCGCSAMHALNDKTSAEIWSKNGFRV